MVLSPDEGSIKRALLYQKKLGGAIAIVDKRRSSATETKQANLIGASLEGKVAVIFDDMISTAGSVVGAANVARHNGAREVYACATHAVLCGPAIERLRDAPIKQIVVTDSIPLPPEKQLPQHQGAERGPAAGRRHQAHPLQRIGEQAVRVETFTLTRSASEGEGSWISHSAQEPSPSLAFGSVSADDVRQRRVDVREFVRIAEGQSPLRQHALAGGDDAGRLAEHQPQHEAAASA